MRYLLLMYLLLSTTVQAASPFVPLDHWSYEYLDELHARGHLPGLNYSNRPFTYEQIQTFLRSLKVPDLDLAEKEMVVLLSRTFGIEDSSSEAIGFFAESGDDFAYRQGATSNWYAGAALHLTSPFFSGVVRARTEERYKSDPDYPWWNKRIAAARFSDNYLKFDSQYLTIGLGRTSWRWGPFRKGSLILSDNAYSFDHLYLQLRLSRFCLSQVTGELERRAEQRRFVTFHRLDVDLGHAIRLGLFESILYAKPYDHGLRDYDFRYLNPFGIYSFEQMNSQKLGTDGNTLIGFDVEWLWRLLNLRTQMVIDDFQVDDKDPGDQEPNMWGGMAGLDLFWPAPVFTRRRYLTVEAAKVTNRVYNAVDSIEQYTYHGDGLACANNDFQSLRIGYHFFPLVRLMTKVLLDVHWQGEGRITGEWGHLVDGNLGFRREKSPTDTVHTQYVFGIQNTYRPQRHLGVQMLVGYQVDRNKDHVLDNNNEGYLIRLKIEAAYSRIFLLKP